MPPVARAQRPRNLPGYPTPNEVSAVSLSVHTILERLGSLMMNAGHRLWIVSRHEVNPWIIEWLHDTDSVNRQLTHNDEQSDSRVARLQRYAHLSHLTRSR